MKKLVLTLLVALLVVSARAQSIPNKYVEIFIGGVITLEDGHELLKCMIPYKNGFHEFLVPEHRIQSYENQAVVDKEYWNWMVSEIDKRKKAGTLK